jgi:hypothetical protein
MDFNTEAGPLPGPEGASPGLHWSFLHPDTLDLDLTIMPRDMADFMSAPDAVNGSGAAAKISEMDPSFNTSEHAQSTPSDTGATPDEPKSLCVKKLSTVMLDLDRIWTTLIPRARLHVPFDWNLPNAKAELADKYSHHKFLEDFFAAAQSLIDVYPTAIRLSLSLCPEDLACEVPDCIHRLPVPSALQPTDAAVEARNSPSTIDLALANMLISCHLRVLDVLDRILSLVLSCLKITVNSPNLEEPDFCVPELRVGSFTPTRGSAAFMQAFLIKHLSELLGRGADKLTEAVKLKMADNNEDKECKVFALQCEILQERQNTKVESLKSVGEELVKVGLMK